MCHMMRLFLAPSEVLSPNISSGELKKKIIESDSAIIEHDFGLLLGSVYFFRPDDSKMLDELVKELHKQPDERKTRAASAWITGGGPSLLSLPLKQALPHHSVFVHALSHSNNYVLNTTEALKNFDLISRKKVRLSTLATGIFYLFE